METFFVGSIQMSAADSIAIDTAAGLFRYSNFSLIYCYTETVTRLLIKIFFKWIVEQSTKRFLEYFHARFDILYAHSSKEDAIFSSADGAPPKREFVIRDRPLHLYRLENKTCCPDPVSNAKRNVKNSMLIRRQNSCKKKLLLYYQDLSMDRQLSAIILRVPIPSLYFQQILMVLLTWLIIRYETPIGKIIVF